MLSKWAEIWFLEVFDDGDSESEFSLKTSLRVNSIKIVDLEFKHSF